MKDKINNNGYCGVIRWKQSRNYTKRRNTVGKTNGISNLSYGEKGDTGKGEQHEKG
ncbi:hypothetical protein JW868_00625 [Candidatus Woesearchaeota archaeon]|nr:hypothetical protein [Candidatus Woesearchaeota archaeon]